MRRGAVGCLAALALALAASGAAAQSTDDSGLPDVPAGTDQGHQQHQHRQHAQPQKVALPDLKAEPDKWPRLDPGAVFCRTAADLRQHLAAIEARLDGDPGAVAEPLGCAIVTQPTGVVVLTRDGPARTEVRLSDAPAETGWTDAFLPAKSGSP